MLMRNEDAAGSTRLRTPPSPLAKGKEVILSRMIPSAPPGQPDHVDLKVQDAIFEILHMNRGFIGLDKWFRQFIMGILVCTKGKFMGFCRVMDMTRFLREGVGSKDQTPRYVDLVPVWCLSEGRFLGTEEMF